MKIKVILLAILSRLIRGAGMGLGVSGIAFTIWFFFLSSSESRYIWGMFSIAEFFAGYLIYRFAYTYVYDE
ncbi:MULTISPECIES: hypothetical protein [Enterobacter cloacae complex]|uniref:hypothetical protein n=1 Tax=Enterobacter cloacae complex TaxID=354276 RepID=UPI00044CE1D7|nr:MULTISPECIES: hypothetical protein [Enterobacter cloacae complex]EUM30429.1 hypothetical protein L462_00751 [Enterobacter sp. BIDMC 26]QIN37594.1 hypothetical protein E5283_00815 [Enterobacter ludwigii]WFY28312.1 hypothetical protein NFK27_07685 [Enterobacter ludwigii]